MESSSVFDNSAKHLGADRAWLPSMLRALIIASSYWVLSLSLTVLSGSIAAVMGCLLACFVIDRKIQQPPLVKLRSSILVSGCLVAALLAIVVSELIISSSQLARFGSAMLSFNSGEFVKWFGITAAFTVVLRIFSHRTSYGSIFEILFVACAFVITLSAHRNGMIHRPFFIGDFALTRGIDPASILMGFGCAAVLSLAALLMIEHSQRRLPYHFLVLGLLCLSLLGYVRLFGLPSPQYTDELGLTGEQQQGTGQRSENPFRDGENETKDKEAPVAIVVFRDDYEPDGGSYYFRESAYSQFNGTMLDYSQREDMDQDLIEHFTASRVESEQEVAAADQRQAVRVSIGMLIPHRNPFGLDRPVAYQNTPNPNNLRFKQTYDALSLAPNFELEQLLGQESGRADWTDEVLAEYLALPDDPRYQQQAQALLANLRPEYADDPFAKALTIKTWLDENGIYSLKNQHAYAEDPAASFLFGDLTGYCMHFSFAATYLFRSVGIPARVGIGYSVPASNRAGGSALLIQAIHGHAWPEIYLRGLGWIIVDPAPQQTLVDMSTDPQNNLQQLLGDMLRNDESFDEFLQSRNSSWIPFQTLLNIIYGLLILGLLVAYVTKFYRLWSPARVSAEKQYRVAYRAALDRLSAVGIHRQTGESRERFAARVGDLAPSFRELTDLHLRYALGSGIEARSPNDVGRWQLLNSKLTTEINHTTANWKKLLAWLNPVSWLMSK